MKILIKFKKAFLCSMTTFLLLSVQGVADEEQVLSVPGKGAVALKATIADGRIGLQAFDKTPILAQQTLTQKQQAVMGRLREMEAENVESGAFYLYPRYDKKEQQVVIGYIASMEIQFQSPANKMGELLDAAFKAGAEKNLGVTLRPSNEELVKGRELALKMAANQALKDAQTLFEHLGVTKKEIREIEIYPSHTPYRAQQQLLQKSISSAEVTENQFTVEADLTMKIEFE